MTAIVVFMAAAWAASAWLAWAMLHGGQRNWEKERP